MRATRTPHPRENSIFRRMLVLLLAVLLVQMGVYLLIFLRGGVVEETERNAFNILTERTANRKLYLENEMLQRWSNTNEGESSVLAIVGQTLERHNIRAEELKGDSQLCQTVVAEAAPAIVDLLRRNGTTGAFLALDSPNGEGNYPGVYIRDYDPGNYSEDNTDLLMERGLPGVAREMQIAMDSYWSAFFHFKDASAKNAQFFFAPMGAAKGGELTQKTSTYYCRWSDAFALSDLDMEAVTYSVPLVWTDGTVLGVLGVEVTVSYLLNRLQYNELGEDRAGAYVLGITQDNGATYDLVAASGPNFHAYFGQPETLRVVPSKFDGTVELLGASNNDGRKFYGAVEPLRLYNTNTPFEGEQWALLGVLDSAHLMGFTRQIQILVVLSSLTSLALGFVLVFLAASSLTRPITGLVEHLRSSDPNKPIRLRRIALAEIDALTEAIENLSNAAAASASRISKIISMAHIPVGVFEYQRGTGLIFCSAGLPALLDWDMEASEDFYMEPAVFRGYLDRASGSTNEEDNLIFRLPQENGGDRWVQLFCRVEEASVLGAFLDITHDMEQKRKIEYERDFDVLTNIYNRRAFDQRANELFSSAHKGELGVAALLMFDLDNLKYVNDTYGHDCGDRYIQAFAGSLAQFGTAKRVIGRRSGDEFNVLLYGGETQNEIRRYADEFWRGLAGCHIPLPDGGEIKVRASAGLAWYPTDAEEFEELMRLSDFAMYNIKHTVKGGMQEFDRGSYEEKSILIHGQDALNRLIDGRLVQYAMQPIVSARDGAIYGYEMLMRPQLEQLANLEKLFRLAKAQSKLHQIEWLTWSEALDAFARCKRANLVPPGTRVFINSIGSQVLTPENVDRLEGEYGDILGRVVMEITEGEEANGPITAKKREIAARWGAKIAIDDFGTGFNSEAVLIHVAPHLVKIDISIVRGIDADRNRLAVVENLIHYARDRNILVLAEGVETRRELETLIDCGVDYIQGFYVGHPTLEVPRVRPEVAEEIRRINEEREAREFRDYYV